MAKRKLTVLVDMDGVLENFTEKWIEALNEKFGTDVDFESLTDWNICIAFPNHSKEELAAVSFEDEFVKSLSPIDGAVQYTKKIINEGHDLYVVTSTDYRVAKSKAVYVLQRYFPFITWKHVIITDRKQMVKGDVLIDDGIHNLIGGEYRKILFTAPYNRQFDAEKNGMRRADTWAEVYQCIQELAEEK